MVSRVGWTLGTVLLTCSVLAAASARSGLHAQTNAPAEFPRALLAIVAEAEAGFSTLSVGAGRVFKEDTTWSVRQVLPGSHGCTLRAKKNDSRSYECTMVDAVTLPEALSAYDSLAGQIREILGRVWTVKERRSESLIRRSLRATRSDGIEVDLTLWAYDRSADVDVEVTAPEPAATASPRGGRVHARTDFQRSLLEMITEADESRFDFVELTDGEVADGDTLYPAVPILESERCDVWGNRDGSREYACVMEAENAAEVESRYDELAGEIREALGATWTVLEGRNGGRNLTATRHDGLQVKLWQRNDTENASLELAVLLP